ncbi:hypothetical protein [Streptomyces cyaneofuscatus]
MTENMIECASGVGDTIDVQESDSGGLRFVARRHGDFKSDLFASRADARTFARGILALADEVDGGDATVEPAPAVKIGDPQMPTVGDRVRVLTDDANHAEVAMGDVFTVTSIGRSDFLTDAGWYFRTEDVEILPAEPTTATVTRPTREAYLHRAAELLGATRTTASELIRLADYMAGENA